MSLAKPEAEPGANSRHPMELVVDLERVTLESKSLFSNEGDIDSDTDVG
jgi:hypothetical protein